MNCKELNIVRKSTKSYALIFKQDGASVDITNWTVYFTVKENMEDSDVNAKIYKAITSHSEPLSGKTLIELSSSDTDITAGVYWYSIDYKDDDENQGVLLSGKMKIKEPILKSRS